MPRVAQLKPVTRLKMKAIMHVSDKLTTWERRFVESVQDRFSLTHKQKNMVDDIYLQRVKGEYTGPGMTTFEDYADVHWRD